MDQKLDEEKVENIGTILSYVKTPFKTARLPFDLTSIIDFTKRVFTFPTEDNFHLMEFHALRCDIITGNLNCPIDGNNIMVKDIIEESSYNLVTDLKREDLIMNCYKCLFKCAYLKGTLLRNAEWENNYDDEPWLDDILKNGYFREQFMCILYSFVIMNTLYERYAFHSDYKILQLVIRNMKCLIESITKLSPNNLQQMILKELKQRSRNVGYYWSFAKRYFESQIGNMPNLDSLNPSDASDSNPKIISSQDRTSSLILGKIQEKLDNDNRNEDEATQKWELEDVLSGYGFHDQQVQLKCYSNKPSDDVDKLRIKFYTVVRSFLEAHRTEVRVIEEFLRDAKVCSSECTMDFLINAYARHKHIILSETNLAAAPWARVVSNAAIADYLDELVSTNWLKLSAKHWNFMTMLLTRFTKSLELSVEQWGCTKVALMTRAALSLFRNVQSLADTTSINIGPLIHFIKTVIRSQHNILTTGHMATLGALSETVRHLQLDKMEPWQVHTVLLDILGHEAILSLLRYQHPSVKLLAFKLLTSLNKHYIKADTLKLLQWSAQKTDDEYNTVDEEPPPALSITFFDDAMSHLQHTVETALSKVRELEETFEVVPYSLHHRPILGYLMLSVALYEQCEMAKGDLVQHYVEHFRSKKYADHWMKNSLRLLPEDVFKYALDETNSVRVPNDTSFHFNYLLEVPVEDACQSLTVGKLACRVFFCAMAGVGLGGARAWCVRAPANKLSVVKRLVAEFVSKKLQWEQIDDANSRAKVLPGVKVEVTVPLFEVRCQAYMRKQKMELCIQYLHGYPLVAPRVSSSLHSRAPKTLWLTTFYNQQLQTGSLFNVFEMWVGAGRAYCRSISKCFICYCSRHLTTGKLPTMLCYRCLNKFHVRCLAEVKKKCPICY